MDTTATYERIDSGTQREFKSIILEKMRVFIMTVWQKKDFHKTVLSISQEFNGI
jgi:hypothetical protein